MRIITWNCNMAFARKHEKLLAMQPDILVLQECSEHDALSVGATFAQWVGSNKHRGLAILTFNGLDAHFERDYFPGRIPWFLPVSIGGLRLIGVWACRIDNRRRYVRLIHEALPALTPFLQSGMPIVAGDFNSNSVFDKKHTGEDHSGLVEKLKRLGLSSAYHDQTGECHGQESAPTFYLYRHLDKPYHLDYLFLSLNRCSSIRVELGHPDDWLTMSDHVPVIVDFDLPHGS